MLFRAQVIARRARRREICRPTQLTRARTSRGSHAARSRGPLAPSSRRPGGGAGGGGASCDPAADAALQPAHPREDLAVGAPGAADAAAGGAGGPPGPGDLGAQHGRARGRDRDDGGDRRRHGARRRGPGARAAAPDRGEGRHALFWEQPWSAPTWTRSRRRTCARRCRASAGCCSARATRAPTSARCRSMPVGRARQYTICGAVVLRAAHARLLGPAPGPLVAKARSGARSRSPGSYPRAGEPAGARATACTCSSTCPAGARPQLPRQAGDARRRQRAAGRRDRRAGPAAALAARGPRGVQRTSAAALDPRELADVDELHDGAGGAARALDPRRSGAIGPEAGWRGPRRGWDAEPPRTGRAPLARRRPPARTPLMRVLFFNEGNLGAHILGQGQLDAALRVGLSGAPDVRGALRRPQPDGALRRGAGATRRSRRWRTRTSTSARCAGTSSSRCARARAAARASCARGRPTWCTSTATRSRWRCGRPCASMPVVLSLDATVRDWCGDAGVAARALATRRSRSRRAARSSAARCERAALVLAWTAWARAAVEREAPARERGRAPPRARPRSATAPPRAGRASARGCCSSAGASPRRAARTCWRRWARQLGRDVELDLVTPAPVAERPGVRVHRLGPSDPRLLELQQQADVLCLPTYGDTNPWALLEAMACGDAGGLDARGRHPRPARRGPRRACSWTHGDPRALREALRALLADPQRRERLARPARERCEQRYDARAPVRGRWLVRRSADLAAPALSAGIASAQRRRRAARAHVLDARARAARTAAPGRARRRRRRARRAARRASRMAAEHRRRAAPAASAVRADRARAWAAAARASCRISVSAEAAHDDLGQRASSRRRP